MSLSVRRGMYLYTVNCKIKKNMTEKFQVENIINLGGGGGGGVGGGCCGWGRWKEREDKFGGGGG